MRVIALGLILGAAVHAAPPAPIPIEDFFAEASVRSVQIAPDGKHIAFLAPDVNHRVGIGLVDLETGKPELLQRASDENLQYVFWKGSDRLVFGGDVGGNESQTVVSIDIRTGSTARLAESYMMQYTADAPYAWITDVLPLDPLHMVMNGSNISGTERRAGREFGAFRINVKTGDRVFMIARDPEVDMGDVVRYVSDNTGDIRLRQVRAGASYTVEYRPDPHTRFKPVADNPADVEEQTEVWRPIEFAADNRTLYVVAPAPGGDGLYAYDAASGRMGEPLAVVPPGEFIVPDPSLGPSVTPSGQIESPILSADRTRFYGIIADGEKPYYRWSDPGRAALQKAIDSAFPVTFNEVIGASADEQLLVILSSSDRDPGFYSLMDRRRHLLMPLGKRLPKIHPEQMAPMKPIQYQARDGLTIHGYLTVPLGVPAGKPLPLILNPHGGPYGIRDTWRFDTEIQFLANRGYAVLQVNYRGSGGYGAKFLEAGRYEWGAKMTDDLIDAVNWAVAQGIADPRRLGVYGASYGGYATLACAVFHPEVFRCAINYVGPSDLVTQTAPADLRHFFLTSYFRQWIGSDTKVLAARSPVNYIQNLKIPLMNAYGENDPRVHIGQWHELKAALDRNHKPYTYIDENNEGHGFKNENSRVHFYREMEAFLAKNLPAD